jgi:hypothetical protein
MPAIDLENEDQEKDIDTLSEEYEGGNIPDAVAVVKRDRHGRIERIEFTFRRDDDRE